ncbi:hypothetical protein QCA50_018524 [Cerrena zonata]|uniref:Uncharacterized protein n=1 Tax=Cerrena zonata TaxID=2478898 RepID=A0AAW0FG21_9APHY
MRGKSCVERSGVAGGGKIHEVILDGGDKDIYTSCLYTAGGGFDLDADLLETGFDSDPASQGSILPQKSLRNGSLGLCQVSELAGQPGSTGTEYKRETHSLGC